MVDVYELLLQGFQSIQTIPNSKQEEVLKKTCYFRSCMFGILSETFFDMFKIIASVFKKPDKPIR